MNIITFGKYKPKIHPTVFLAETSRVIGRVEIGERSSLWFGALARGDQDKVIVGAGTNLQDGVVVHVSGKKPCIIGDYVTAGHNAVIHACTIGSFTLVGIGSVVLDGATVGEGSVIAAGTVVPPGKEFPPRSFILGIPGRFLREVTEEEYQRNINMADSYLKLAAEYMKQKSS